MVRAAKGVLVQCDASIKAIISKIDAENGNEFIIQDLDDETAIVKEPKLPELQRKLKEALKDTVREPEDSESDN